MANYNLDTVAKSFSLALRGEDGASLEFDIKYPNTAEMRRMLKESNDLEALIQSGATVKEIEKKSKQSEKELNDLITPVGHEFAFSDVFANQPINVQREFQAIIRKEFGGEQG